MTASQLELALPSMHKADAWRAANPLKDALRRHHRDEEPYNPRKLRKLLLVELSETEWTGFIGLADECRQSVDAISRVLDLLKKRGRVEKTPLYFYPWSELVQPDRTVHPGHGKQYTGFEFGYRLKAKSPANPALPPSKARA